MRMNESLGRDRVEGNTTHSTIPMDDVILIDTGNMSDVYRIPFYFWILRKITTLLEYIVIWYGRSTKYRDRYWNQSTKTKTSSML